MSIASRLSVEFIRVAPPWRTFEETIEGLVQSLVDGGRLPPAHASSAVRAVVAREEQASTALLDIHVAVPHARLPEVDGTLVSLTVAAGGLYEAVPTVPIQIAALVLSPTAANTDHLTVLAEIATLLRSESLRTALLAARDAGEVLRAIRRHA